MNPTLLAASGMETEELLLSVLLQLIVIVAAARLGGRLFRWFGQPQVVGEIAAGLMLGPSLLGRFDPQLLETLFPAHLSVIFRVLSELGLVFLMFLIGLEFEFGHLRQLGRAAAGISVAGIAFPFALGIALAAAMHPYVAADLDRRGFLLFMAIALSITAIPILGRIMMEFHLTRTRMGVLTITAAAIDDATGWILLATIAATVQGDFQPATTARMLGMTLGFVLLVFLVARPLLVRWSARVLWQGDGEVTAGPLALLIVLVLGAAVVTNAIGIFSIFGPFVLGAALWDQHELRQAVSRKLRDFVFAFFLPIFFTYTGLRTDIGLLDTPLLWLFCALVLLTGVVGKALGCGLAARWGGRLSWRESGCVATMMNTRGLMELIVVNLGRELGVIPDSVFCMLVIMALITTWMTAPLLRRLIRGTEFDPSLWCFDSPPRHTGRQPARHP